VQRLQEELEILRQAHEVVLPPRQAIRACSAVRIFAERAAYEKHVGPEAKWSGGLWVPRMRELVISAPEQAGGARMKEIVGDVVYHEATHQYIFYALNKNDPAVWFNEGLAEFFEMARLTRTGVSFEENDDHRERVLKMIKGGKADLAAFMAIDYPAFYDAEQPGRRAPPQPLRAGLEHPVLPAQGRAAGAAGRGGGAVRSLCRGGGVGDQRVRGAAVGAGPADPARAAEVVHRLLDLAQQAHGRAPATTWWSERRKRAAAPAAR
jgi:hypothetical protein